MKRIVLTIIMSLSFFSLFAQTEKFKIVGVEEFAEFIKNPDVIVLDVRTPEEYKEGHIPGTDFNIDVLEKSFSKEADKKLKDGSPVALYCRSGNRSKTAARILAEKGFEVVELGTGFRGWTASKKPVEK